MSILSQTATLAAVTFCLTLFAAGTALGDSRSCMAAPQAAGSPGSACESAEIGSVSGHALLMADSSAIVLASLEPTFRRLEGVIGRMADQGQGQHADAPGYARRPSGAVRMARPASASTDAFGAIAASEAAMRESTAAAQQSVAASNQQMEQAMQQATQAVAASMEEANRAIEVAQRSAESALSAASSH